MTGRTADELAGRVARALDLAERVTAMLLDRTPLVDLSALEAPPDKVLAETALLVRAAAAIPAAVAPALSGRTARLAAALRPHASSLRVGAGMAMHPALARDYGLAHRCLTAAGYPDAQMEALLVTALTATTAAGRERLPHRALEQEWIDHLAGGRWPSTNLAATALGRGIDVITGSRDDVYALTHAVIYATDLGATTIDLPRAPGAIFREAESVLAGAIDDDDFDLAGEILMLWPMLGFCCSDAADFGVTLLCELEDDIGLVPSLAIDGRSFLARSGQERHEFALATTYHTAYVMGMLCASLLRRPGISRPPAAAQDLPGLLAVAQGALMARSKPSRWQSTFAQLPSSRQHALAPFVLDVALRGAIRRFDFSAVHQLVTAAAAHQVETTAVEQAAALLDRMRYLTAAAAD
jgi:hypothetical protein